MSSSDSAIRARDASRVSAFESLSYFASRHPHTALFVAIVAAALLGQLTAAAKLRAVWTTGAFFDTDDAMRAVEVRDLLAGQGWFDLTQYRLDPPEGVFMHWSRIVDAPLALLMKTFGLLADPVFAERAARLAFPFLLTIAVFAVLVALCERLLGPRVRWPALIAAFLSGPATGQFEPGRIDHHAPQIVLVALAILGLTAALIEHRRIGAFIAGAAIALSLGISVENVPMFAAMGATLIVFWVLDGPRVGVVLTNLSLGLASTLPLVYVTTIAPNRWTLVVADALSMSQGCAAMAASALFLTLVAMARRLADRAMNRVAFAAIACGGIAAILIAAFPDLVQPPFTHLDPVVRHFWLNGVEEAQPLARKFVGDPLSTLAIVVPAVIGIGGALNRAFYAPSPAHRRAWVLLACTAIGGFAAGAMMVRAMSAVLTLAVPGALALSLLAWECAARRAAIARGPFAVLVLLLTTSSMGWAAACSRIALHAAKDDSLVNMSTRSPVRADFATCTALGAMTALKRLPDGLVVADPDLGGYVLAQTSHAVVAGAYHRNERGLRRTIDLWLATPDEAHRLLRAMNATYVAFCREAIDTQFVDAAPRGLASMLVAKTPPVWLRPLVADESALTIYQVD